jgi:hypothetical protein
VYLGHVGAALAGKRARTSVGLLALLIATYAPDWVDTGLCLTNSYNEQGMYSHSIPAVALFAVLGFLVYFVTTRDRVGATVVAAVVLSHMVLDWVTGYKPTWPGGPMIGLQLYGHPAADFVAEGFVLAIGAALYATTLPPKTRKWSDGAIMFVALIVMQLGADVAHTMMRSLSKC